MVNQILNQRYQIQKELGRQTSRRTFLATDIQTSQPVVVKLLYLGEDFEWQDLKLFQREAETLKTLDHPAIPRYLDYFEIDTEDDKGFCLVQSYVEGKTLESHLQAGRTFSEAEVKELAIALLEILSYLQSFEIPVIHRDIKPSNILLTNRSGNSVGQVYLVDFGSVQNLAAHEGGTITVVGTYGYMPPEQFGGRATPASDLYSLGATLIFLATGMHPTELPQKDFQIQFRSFSHLSEEFTDWLEWMTEPSLDKRFASPQEAITKMQNTPLRKTSGTLVKKRFKQPIYSKVKLTKTPEELEIIFAPKGLGLGLIASISIATPFAIGFNFITQFALSGTLIYYLPLSIAIQILATLFIITSILWGFFKHIRLQINSRKLEVFHYFLGKKWRAAPMTARQNISNIVLIHSHRSEFTPEMYLELLSERSRYYLNIYGNLTEEELEWLVQELGEWLNLPAD